MSFGHISRLSFLEIISLDNSQADNSHEMPSLIFSENQ